MPAKYPETERSDDVSIDVCALPSAVHAVTIAASVEGTTSGEVGELVWLVLLETGEIATSFAVQGMTTERALVLGELYRRGETWRLRAIGQGWDGGLAGRATDFGIDVAGDEPETDGQGDVPEEFAISEAESLVDPAADFTGGPTQSQGATRASTALTEAQTPPTTGAGYVSEPVVNDAVNDESTTTAIDPATRTPDCTGVINRPPSAPGSTRVRIRPTKTKPVTAPVMTLGDDPSWGPARLFSVSGIGGVDEQEKRATSALLWVMSAVRPLIPDGVIRIARGGKVWTALVEVKTGDAALERTQIENYVRLANRRKIRRDADRFQPDQHRPRAAPDRAAVERHEVGFADSPLVVRGDA